MPEKNSPLNVRTSVDLSRHHQAESKNAGIIGASGMNAEQILKPFSVPAPKIRPGIGRVAR